jgi:tetratricopeptide (TPR) repeat protein
MIVGKAIKPAVMNVCVFALLCLVSGTSNTATGDPIHKKIKDLKQSEVQKIYAKAVELYLKENYKEAKPLLEELINKYPEKFVYNPVYYKDYGHDKDAIAYKSGPAALDMLARIYFKENRKQEAMNCFQKMIKQYPMDYFQMPYENVAYYGGPAGAEGRRYLMDIYLHQFDFYGEYVANVSENEFDKAVVISFELLRNYGNIESYCWEDCPTYGWIAADDILKELKSSGKPMNIREMYSRKFIDASKDNELKVWILLNLANDYKETKDYEKANKRYKELIRNYPYVYSVDEGSIYAYSLEAYVGILEIYKAQKQPAKSVGKLKMEMKKHLENFCRELKNGNSEYLKPQYEKYTK